MIYLTIYLNRPGGKKMHGHGHHGHGWRWEGHGWKWAGGRHGGGGGRFGFGGRGKWDFGGRDPEDWMRVKRMLAQGDLRLIALALIAQAPRHGYEIIKLIEEKTGDWYSPSPGIVYPTLTYLEEAGYVTGSSEGSKKLYTITDEGREYLKAHNDVIKVVLARLEAIGERVGQWRRARGNEREAPLPPLVDAAIKHL